MKALIFARVNELVFLSICFLPCIHAQGSTTFRRRAGHAVTKHANELVVHGGLESDTNNVLRYGHKTWFIPFGRSWTNKGLTATAIENPASGLINQDVFPDEARQWIYAMNGALSSNGGIDKSDLHPNSFWKTREPEIWALNMALDAEKRFWEKIAGQNAPTKFPPGLTQVAGGTHAVDSKRAYLAGGDKSYWTGWEISNGTMYIPAIGLIRFNFDSRTLTNSTDDGDCFQANPHGPIFEVPFGSSGTLVSFAGLSSSKATADEQTTGFGSILVCDKGSNKTYSQNTTGDVPPAGLNPNWYASFYATDELNGTFEIYFHGRLDQTSKNDTMYILSLPSFRWSKSDYQNYPRREGMVCESANNNQAICTGGLNPESSAPYNMTDEWDQGILVIDLAKLVAKGDYSADAPPYSAPDIVRRAYENSAQFPTTYDSPEVGRIFGEFQATPDKGRSRKSLKTSLSVVIPIVSLVLVCLLYRYRRRIFHRFYKKQAGSRNWLGSHEHVAIEPKLGNGNMKATVRLGNSNIRSYGHQFNTQGGKQNTNTGSGVQQNAFISFFPRIYGVGGSARTSQHLQKSQMG